MKNKWLIIILGLFIFNSASATAEISYINTWMICGPFENSGLETECFENESGITPVKGDAFGRKKWKLYSSVEGPVNFEDPELFGSYDNCVGYAFAEIKSPERKEALLLLGSDDGIKVWLNGRNVLNNNIPRGLAPDEDKVNVILDAGWNRLMIKVNDLSGGWSFAARFTDHNGLPVEGLEYRPKGIKSLTVKEVTASSIEKESFSPRNVVDGDLSTRWSSIGEDSQWICLDLGKPKEINKIFLLWEAAYAESYSIELSNDKENWQEIFSIESSDGGKDVILFLEPQTGRYIKLNCIKRVNKSWGNSLFEFQVFGSEDNQVLNN